MSSLSSSSSSSGDIVLGLLIVVVAGCLNGSWNASFSDQLGLAVKKRQSKDTQQQSEQQQQQQQTRESRIDLEYHFAWILFQFYAAIINIPICLYWVGGPERTSWIVRQSSSLDIFLIVLFSILWGVGSVGFGLACRIAGVGLGTNLTMGVIMVLGTLLPLLLEEQATTTAGAMIFVGLFLCCVGLFFSVKSLRTRDLDDDEAAAAAEQANANNKPSTNNSYSRAEAIEGGDDDEDGDVINVDMDADADVDADADEEKTQESPMDGDDKIQPSPSSSSSSTITTTTTTSYSTFHKVAVCVIAGVFATQLQFAFVFGDNLIDLASSDEGPGSTPSSGSAAIIWLFAIPVGAPVSIVYGFYSSPREIPIWTIWRCPWYRHMIILLTTSMPFVAHIHLYGYSNSTLPDEIAASVSWPVLMMVTVMAGLGWSLILGEWRNASVTARRQLCLGMAVVLSGVCVLMASAAV